MKINNKKKIIMSTMFILLISFIIVFGIVNNNNRKQLHLNNKMEKINSYLNDFDSKEKREEKLEILASIKNDYINRSSSENDKIVKSYIETIDKMKDWFISDYNKTINDNSFNEIEKVEDKKALEDSKNKLNDLIKSIEIEAICKEEQLNSYKESIKQLTSKYDERINEIVAKEKVDEESRIAKEKEEEVRIANEKAEEENKLAKANANKNDSSNSSQKSSDNSNKGNESNSSNKNNNSSSNKNSDPNADRKQYWFEDDNGKQLPGTEYWRDNEGHCYDKDGNRLYDLEKWIHEP